MNIEINKIPKFNEYAELEAEVTVTSADEASIPYEEADHKIVILVSNKGGNSAEVTFEKGDMLQGTEDLIVTVPAETTVAIALESGKFKKKDGNVKATVSGDLSFQLIALP